MPRKRWLSLALASFLSLSASRAGAQDSSLYVPWAPASVFTGGVQYLVTTRDAGIKNPAPFIAGPDVAAMDDAALIPLATTCLRPGAINLQWYTSGVGGRFR